MARCQLTGRDYEKAVQLHSQGQLVFGWQEGSRDWIVAHLGSLPPLLWKKKAIQLILKSPEDFHRAWQSGGIDYWYGPE